MGVNDEGADAFGAGGVIGARKHHIKVGDATIGNPRLLAIQHVVTTHTLGAATHGGHV
jgi:hypothetical protein